MRVLGILQTSKIVNSTIVQQNKAVSKNNNGTIQALNCDVTSFGMAKLPPKANIKVAYNKEFLETVEHCKQVFCSGNIKASLSLIEELSKKNKDFLSQLVLYENTSSKNIFKSIFDSQVFEAYSKHILLKLDPKVQEQFILSVDNQGDSFFEKALLQDYIAISDSNLAKSIVNFVKRLPVDIQEKFVLSKNKDGQSFFMLAIYSDKPEIVQNLMDMVKKFTEKSQIQFVLFQNAVGQSHVLNICSSTKMQKTAKDFFGLIKKLPSNVQEEFILSTNKSGERNLMNGLTHTNSSEVIKEIFGLLKKAPKEVLDKFILPPVNKQDKSSHLITNLLLSNFATPKVKGFIDLIKKSSADTQQKFINNEDLKSAFNVTINQQIKLVMDILDFILHSAPHIIPEIKIEKNNRLSEELYHSIARKVASCPNLSKTETLLFLIRNNDETAVFRNLITVVEENAQ